MNEPQFLSRSFRERVSAAVALLELLLRALFELLVQLTVTYPKVMVPIWIAVAVIPILFSVTSRWLRERGWTTGKPSDEKPADTTDTKA